jgi:uracil-DNA glycosylase
VTARTARTARTRPLLLGEAPARDGDPARPLARRPARRVCALLGWDDGPDPYARLLSAFDVLNAIERREDAYPWSAPRARDRWRRWVADRGPDAPRVVVCLGRRAAAAVGHDGDWYEWRSLAARDVALVPHPSGLNHAWNDPATGGRVRAVLEDALRRAADPATARPVDPVTEETYT